MSPKHDAVYLNMSVQGDVQCVYINMCVYMYEYVHTGMHMIETHTLSDTHISDTHRRIAYQTHTYQTHSI